MPDHSPLWIHVDKTISPAVAAQRFAAEMFGADDGAGTDTGPPVERLNGLADHVGGWHGVFVVRDEAGEFELQGWADGAWVVRSMGSGD